MTTKPPISSVTLTPDQRSIEVVLPWEDKAIIASFPGRQWRGSTTANRWRVPCTHEVLLLLKERLPLVDVPQEVREVVAQRVAWREAVLAAHLADLGEVSMPVRGTPFKHQKRAYVVALTLLGFAPHPKGGDA